MEAAVVLAATEDVTSGVQTGEVPEELQKAEASFWRSAVIGVLFGGRAGVTIAAEKLEEAENASHRHA